MKQETRQLNLPPEEELIGSLPPQLLSPPPPPPQQQSSYFSTTQLPWLMLPSVPGTLTRTFYILSDGRCCNLHVPDLLNKHCYLVSHGWLLIGNEITGERSLLNPVTHAHKRLPDWEFRDPMQLVAMSSSPDDPNCVISSVLVNRVIYCHPGDARWSVQRSTGSVPDDSISTDYIFYNGKFLFLKPRRKLMVIDLVGGGGCKQLDMNCKLLPPVDRYRYNFLVESNGELLLVTSSKAWSSCKIFRADMVGKAWVSVESLGEHVLFLGRGCSVSVPVTMEGIHGDRLYFSFPPFPVIDEPQQSGGRSWRCFWAVFVIGIGSGPLRYAPPIRRTVLASKLPIGSFQARRSSNILLGYYSFYII